MTWALEWFHTFRYARYFVKYVQGLGAVGIIQLAAVTVGRIRQVCTDAPGILLTVQDISFVGKSAAKFGKCIQTS